MRFIFLSVCPAFLFVAFALSPRAADGSPGAANGTPEPTQPALTGSARPAEAPRAETTASAPSGNAAVAPSPAESGAPKPPRPGRRAKVYENRWLTLELPKGWRLVSRVDNEESLGATEGLGGDLMDLSLSAAHFTDRRANFLILYVDPPELGLDVDANWVLEPGPVGERARIAQEGLPCTAEERKRHVANRKQCLAEPDSPSALCCSAGDRRLDISTVLEVDGHRIMFTFGNNRREKNVDLEPYRQILTSIRLK